jgi:CHAD domain-containing protein
MDSMDRGEASTSLTMGGQAILREHLFDSLSERLQAFRKAARRCRRQSSEEAVHHLRVQLRRLLAFMELLGAVVPEVHLERSRKKLKKRLDHFDDLRDTHVQLLFIEKILANFPELKRLHKKLRRREKRLLKPAAKRAKESSSPWLGHSKRMIKRHLRTAFASTARSRPTVRLLKNINKTFERVTRLRKRIDPKHLETIHRTRIAFKEFRYMIELLQPVLPGIKPRQLVAMDGYQTMMGEIQDVEMMIETLDELVRKGKMGRVALIRFREFLVSRQTMLVGRYLQAADELFTFWPPAGPIFRTAHLSPTILAA